MNYGHIFWDWNGTLLDDLAYSVETVNLSLKKRGLDELTLEKYLAGFRFPISEYYGELGFDFEKESYEKLAAEYSENYAADCQKIRLHKEVKEILAVFAGKNIAQYILSASEKGVLLNALDFYGIKKYFSEILALDNIYAHGKIDIGRRFLEKLQPEKKVLLVGDSEHDFEVAQALEIDCVLCSRGHGSTKRLSSLGVPVIENLYGLYPYVFGEITAKSTYFSTISADAAERRSFNLEESEPNNFRTRYKDFYDDLKNTSKTEDW